METPDNRNSGSYNVTSVIASVIQKSDHSTTSLFGLGFPSTGEVSQSSFPAPSHHPDDIRKVYDSTP